MQTKKSRYKLLQTKINEHSKHICIPNNVANKPKSDIDLNTNLMSNVKSFNTKIIKKNFQFKKDSLKNEAIKTIRYRLFPTKEQEIVFQNWFSAHIEMYNCVMNKIKSDFKSALSTNTKTKLVNLNINLDITDIKKDLSGKKSEIKEKYGINMHVLDYAISDAISMYKSKISNLKNGHIKKTRLKYLKQTKSTKIFKIEKLLCQKNTFCVSSLGTSIKSFPEINFKEETEIVGIVRYNKHKNEYEYLVRKRILHDNIKKYNFYNKLMQSYDSILSTSNQFCDLVKKINKNTDISKLKDLNKEINKQKRRLNKNIIYDNEKSYQQKQSANKNIVSIDPGIRTFLTCLSDDHIKEIGTNMGKIIKNKLIYLDKISNNENLNKKKQNKLLSKTRNKIKNCVNDYHWKTINHLTAEYKHILIGNFSTKDMGESNQRKMIKRIGSNMRFYVFKSRLQYKCYLSGTKYAEIDEYCTSKCCSACGKYKSDLYGQKIYNCLDCGLIIDRDINASKNILLKSIR